MRSRALISLLLTIHNAFELDSDLKTKLDLSCMENKKVKKLHETDLLCLDEVSMQARRGINARIYAETKKQWYSDLFLYFPRT